MTERRLFLDTSFEIALLSSRDQFHRQAQTLVRWVKEHEIGLVTTWAILLEIGNALARQKYRQGAAALLNGLENDPGIEIVPFTYDLYQQAVCLYAARLDKEWGLTDCLSFTVMHNYRLTAALTADGHFQQAGFRALLREED